MDSSSSMSRVRSLRKAVVVAATATLLMVVPLALATVAHEHQRLAPRLAGSAVLLVVKSLRALRHVETVVLMALGTLALGVLIGVAVEASLRRSGEHSGQIAG